MASVHTVTTLLELLTGALEYLYQDILCLSKSMQNISFNYLNILLSQNPSPPLYANTHDIYIIVWMPTQLLYNYVVASLYTLFADCDVVAK